VFYGAGAALFSVVQRVPSGSVAGLGAFLNGKTAALVAADVWLFAAAAVVVLAVTLLLFKELTLLCFDDEFAAAEGWPVFGLDALLIGLVAAVAIIGMQSVGLILVVAILIIPAAAARFWTDDVRWMTALSAAFGATGSGLGVGISALFPRIAAGAVIVLCGGALFAISLCFGRRRGVIGRWMAQRRLEQTVAEHDLLRAVYEHVEAQTTAQNGADRSQFLATPIDPHVVQAMRAWPPRRLATLLDWAASDGLLRRERDGAWRLTEHGLDEATRVVRNHRLWEMYLIRYADVAPSRVDHAADMIEHVLDPAIIRELEELLEEREEHAAVPASPH
jgi:manganese/zinc/iron transport system permease protein